MKGIIVGSIVLVASISSFMLGVKPANAEMYEYPCYRTIVSPSGTSAFTYLSTCLGYRQSNYDRLVNQVNNEIRNESNAWIDNNANIRSGASEDSGVMFQTTDRERAKVEKWSGDWAWIKLYQGFDIEYGWTHRVNVKMD